MTDERAAVDLKQWEYQWTFLGRRYRAVETEPGIISYFATEIDSDHAKYERIKNPLGLTNELVHMAIGQDALRAENERLKAENASLKEANEIDLGEKAPLIFENTELSARVSELTRLLAEAEEKIRDAAEQVGGEPEFSDERCSYESIQVDYGWRKEWRESAPVLRALQSGEGKEPSR